MKEQRETDSGGADWCTPPKTAFATARTRAPTYRGAVMVFVALVAGPSAYTAITFVLCLVLLGTINPTIRQAESIAVVRWLHFLYPPLSAVLLVGIYGLTARGRDDGISDELRAGVRGAGVVHALALVLSFVAWWQRDPGARALFETVKAWGYFAVEALVALVAARLLTGRGWPRAATLGRVTAASVVAYGFARSLIGDLSSRLGDYAAPALTITVWSLKLAALGTLLHAMRGDEGRAGAERRRRRTRATGNVGERRAGGR